MGTMLRIGNVEIDVVLKDVKNVHLSVYPPRGAVRIAAPRRMKIDQIRLYAISKLAWIRKQQKEIQGQEREPAREFIERESHYVWGRRYLLRVEPTERKAFVELMPRRLILHVRPRVSQAEREQVMQAWYRQQLRSAAAPLIKKWERLIGVSTSGFFVQQMKTKWGSCNKDARTIRLNTELAKKPMECLEYLVVHELVHLIEPNHSAVFVSLMDHYMPRWKFHRRILNRLPIREERWTY